MTGMGDGVGKERSVLANAVHPFFDDGAEQEQEDAGCDSDKANCCEYFCVDGECLRWRQLIRLECDELGRKLHRRRLTEAAEQVFGEGGRIRCCEPCDELSCLVRDRGGEEPDPHDKPNNACWRQLGDE